MGEQNVMAFEKIRRAGNSTPNSSGSGTFLITSAENRGWPDDVPVANLKLAGLPVPSLIRSAKIATIDASDASKLGRVAAAQLRRVTSKIRQRLGAA